MYVVSRRRHRLCCRQRTADCGVATVGDEEFHTQMTDAEKTVLQGILRKNGALCLSLRLPESTLSVPMSSVIPDEAQSDGSTTPQPQPDVAEADLHTRDDGETQSMRSAVSGLGVMIDGGAADPAHATPGSTRRSITSTATVVTKTRRTTPATVVFHPSVSWSSPVDDKSRRSIIRAVPETMGNITPVPHKVSVLSGHANKAYVQSPRSAPISFADSNFESISSANTPVTPHILSSPCDSVDYVVVPPSPSISSLYGVSVAGTLSRPPSVMSPRSVNMNKSTSSPGGLTGSSLFSPPPVPNKRHFESHLV
ncbi:hypothetical protein IWW50_007073 [Coemansia erecta]|nr:hypothetical protein IWW50_007073 [Coemansia erecta]